MSIERTIAEAARAWPFEEARKIVARLGGAGLEKTPAKGYVLFETGYGPSGLPHIGTFGEVVRTTMVRQAFQRLSDIPTRLFCFSDDMDGMRKVPDNVPNREMLAAHLGKPLTAVPGSVQQRVSELRRGTTTPGCAPSSIPSASSTSSSRRPSGTSRAASTRCCWPCCGTTTRSRR